MLQASAEQPAAAAAPASLWVPGMSPQTVDGGSSRAQEIARRREELLGMLHDLPDPESESELSLTPRREGRRRGQRQRQRGAASVRGEGGKPGGDGAVGVRQAGGAAAGGGGEAGEVGVREAVGQREQLPQQQRRCPAQLLHAPLPRPQLHRAAPRPLAGGLRRPDRQRHFRLQQEGERRRYRQVLVAAVGSAVAEVEPARPERAPPNESTVRAASAAILKAANHSAPPAKI